MSADRLAGYPSPAPVSILYFSGAGGTKLAAELLGRLLPEKAVREIRSIEEEGALQAAADADFLVLCYPTYFLKPAPAMMEFMRSLSPLREGVRAALLTTYELYTGNCNRIAARLLRDRGVAVAEACAIRAPGTDVTCVVPDWLCGWLYRFERRFPWKMARIARRVSALTEAASVTARIPPPKWYTFLSWPIQALFLDGFIRWKDRMMLLEERCVSCDRCVRECHRGCWRRSDSGLAHFGDQCDLCLRCVHRCPERAIVLREALKDNARLTPGLYRSLFEEALRACGDDIRQLQPKENP